MSVLVTGFGAFPGVPLNPTAALVRAIDGREVAGVPIVGLVLPVSYARAPALTVRAAREVGARLVVGLGVATSRAEVEVERVGRRAWSEHPDVDGDSCAALEGPELVAASVDVGRLAAALRASISSDAGSYVCNAWLYRVASALDVPVGFVHVPSAGMDPDRLVAGLAGLLTS